MICCSAPGKIFLSGEYAVLLGSPAVVTAVDRRAQASLSSEPDLTSPVIRAVMAHTSRHLGLVQNDQNGPVVKSAGFRMGRHKLGLGSSAAVAASAVGVMFEHASLPVSDHRETILEVAKDAHRDAQNGKGSGADVATAVMGGTIIYTLGAPPRPVKLDGLYIQVVWSGRSVSTTSMIDQVNLFKAARPKQHNTRMEALSRLAHTVAAAFTEQNPRNTIRIIRRYAAALDAFGTEAKVPIVTKSHRCLINLAEELGGAAKPSGAGGGDIAVAFFTSERARERFRVQCIRHEMPILDIAVDAPGLIRDFDGITEKESPPIPNSE